MSQTRHVLRDDPPGKTLAVNISAARNEWESFQILMRSDEPVKEINVVAADLIGPEGAVLKATDARLYRQHQFLIKDGSYRNNNFKPGWYPDALIPFVLPVGAKPIHGARFAAVPFRLPADETHGFWCDLYVPPGTKPGPYRGTYHVTASGGRSVAIPVTLWVWDFQLPAVPTMKTCFGGPHRSVRLYYQRRAEAGNGKPVADLKALGAQVDQVLSEHHFNVGAARESVPVAQADGSFRIPDEQVRALRDRIDRYRINAIGLAKPTEVIKDPIRERAKLHAWLAAIDRAAQELHRPDVLFFLYLMDEPHDPNSYEFVRTWGRAIREAKSVVQVLVTARPERDANLGDLYGAVDIWCPHYASFSPNAVAKRQALGETIWTYTCLCQGKQKTPWWETDFPLLNYRVPAWMMWHYRVRGLLYWGGMSYWTQVKDPWTDPATMKGDLVFNGEGSLVYPGRDVGYEGIAPSIRLKALRDSIEDYEYLAILERLGLDAEAEKIIKPLVGSWTEWDPDPVAYELARHEAR